MRNLRIPSFPALAFLAPILARLTGTPRVAALTLGAAFLGAGSPAACDATYTITELGSFKAGGYGIATAINNSGQVAGWTELPKIERQRGSYTFSYIVHAFRWDPNTPNGTTGVLKDLGAINGNWSAASDINDAGQVVGWTGENPALSSKRRAFVHNGQKMNTLPMPSGQDWSAARGINNLGQVVGTAGLGQGYMTWGTQAIRWDSRSPTNLGGLSGSNHTASAITDSGRALGESGDRAFRTLPNALINPATDSLGNLGVRSGALASNASDEVVGYYLDAADFLYHAFVHRAGNMVDLGPPLPGLTQTYASGINDLGNIVGRSFWSEFIYSTLVDHNTAVIWRNGQIIDLNTLIPSNSGWYLEWARDINNAGQIVCRGRRAGSTVELLLTPNQSVGP